MLQKSRNQKRIQRARRSRIQAKDHRSRLRLHVFRSLRNITAQVIDDSAGKTVVAVSTKKDASVTKEAAAEVGREIAEQCKQKDIAMLSFDRSGYAYHGRVKALVDAVRSEGITI